MSVRKLTASALFLALCYVLPFFGLNVPYIGKMLLLMHVPVFLAGLTLGWQYGLLIGFIAPLTRSLMFGAPVFYPDAIVMAVELATYGAISGLIYKLTNKLNKYASIYISLISAMIIGRIIWGSLKAFLTLFGNVSFSFHLFIVGGFLNAIPGIIIQLILVPLLVPVIEKVVNKKENKAVLQNEKV